MRRKGSMKFKKFLVVLVFASICIGATIYVTGLDAKSAVSSVINQTFDTNLEVTLPEYKDLNGLDIVQKYNTLHEKNSDVIGWIRVENTNIDYPILYRDNQTYLYSDYEHNYNQGGSIFLDESSSPDFEKVILLHGHNMLDGTMFGSIPRIFNGNVPIDSKIELYDGKELIEYEVFSKFQYSVDDMLIETMFYNEESYAKYVNQLASLGGVTLEETYQGDVIVFSTCRDSEGPVRLAVCAKRK